MRSFLTVLLTAVVFLPLTANATDVEGDVWGTWTRENSPYNVIGEVRVPPGSTLVIEPGILVDFKGHYKFIVDSLATLLAIGTETDSIFFTTGDTATGWHGIRFMYGQSNSELSYCRLEYGKALGTGHDRHGGAVYCLCSDPRITNNNISENYADEYGGGIYCKSSNPKVINNTLSMNTARGGGGMFCDDKSSPTVSHNDIRDNEVRFNGGGIYCWLNSSPTISDNRILGNWARWNGGGIYCNRCSSPTIRDNVISGNRADWSFGGGVYCYQHSDPRITGNNISANFADFGGGIYCLNCSPGITNNIISRNFTYYHGAGMHCEHSYSAVDDNTFCGNWAAWGYGGGIYSAYSSLTVTNTILWEDSASYGQEIGVGEGPAPIVSYCDVQGGWPGEGNIDADPIFVGPQREDFRVRWRSPCIDAGVPDSLDPDGTRSDMGAFYFNQDVLGIVELYPHDTPIVIPRQGGELSFDGWVFNFSGQSGRADIWTYLFAPEVGRYGPLDLYNVRIPADSLGLNEISRHVPEVAPEGDYVFVAYVGDYPSTIIDSSYFYFTKEGEVVGVTGDWTEDNLPLDYALFQNYPNPFNATTRIDYQLPLSCDVKLEIYNVLGQRVATLADEKQEAGYRSVVWDASEVSSGLYFYKLTAGDFTETRRMMLVK